MSDGLASQIAEEEKSAHGKDDRPVVAFLLPTYKTPFLTSDLLSAAIACKKFDGCTFVLLLDARDPYLLMY